ncbi:hypothetical protein BH18ACT11_BH18ACT11_24030 [soil metagenome]
MLDGPLQGLEPLSPHWRCELPPMSPWSAPPHSFPPDPTPSAATRCMSDGLCSISEPRLLHETDGWSRRSRSWSASSTGRFFEKSKYWSKRSGRNTFGTGSWFDDTFNGWCRTPYSVGWATLCLNQRSLLCEGRVTAKYAFTACGAHHLLVRHSVDTDLLVRSPRGDRAASAPGRSRGRHRRRCRGQILSSLRRSFREFIRFRRHYEVVPV